MTTLLSYLLVLLILFAFFIYRNIWVYNTRSLLIKAASVKAKEAIENNETDWKRYYDWYDNLPSYDKMMFMISVWDCNEWIKTLPD